MLCWQEENGGWRLRLSLVTLEALPAVLYYGAEIPAKLRGWWVARVNSNVWSEEGGTVLVYNNPIARCRTAAEARRAAVEALIPLLQSDLIALDAVLENEP